MVALVSSTVAGSMTASLSAGWPSELKLSVRIVAVCPSGLRTEEWVIPVSGSVRRGAATE